MCDFGSARDPLFYARHALIDRIWFTWQKVQVMRGPNEFNCGKCTHFTTKALRAKEFTGKFDAARNCFLYPTTNPSICLQYLARGGGATGGVASVLDITANDTLSEGQAQQAQDERQCKVASKELEEGT